MPKKILIIEDNSDISHLIKVNLLSKNIEIDCAFEGESGLKLATDNHYQLIILDLMLPKLDGMDVCRQLRDQKNFTPILMLTAKNSELDRVLGLEVGADDYLTKPFSIPELLARVNALIRRSEHYQQSLTTDTSDILQFAELKIDPRSRQVTLQQQAIDLTAKEFDLLLFFASNPGHVYSREHLLTQIWGYGHDGYEHTVNSHINRLRSKIEHDPAHPNYVMTVWGVGYKFNQDLKAL